MLELCKTLDAVIMGSAEIGCAGHEQAQPLGLGRKACSEQGGALNKCRKARRCSSSFHVHLELFYAHVAASNGSTLERQYTDYGMVSQRSCWRYSSSKQAENFQKTCVHTAIQMTL